ncbi:MAG TPA: ABC transporter permease [Gemmatimonadales bacterium]|jgi:putative ABC transport system permease protein|nr:ABC transporter permease [Gemmatimonadales bacterium]
MTPLTQDVRFALRTLLRRRGFAAVAIATLALGIGAATSIYTVVDGILFRPLPFRDAARLTAVWQTFPSWKKDPILSRSWDKIGFSIPEYTDWRVAQRSFSAVAIQGWGAKMLSDGATHELVALSTASASYLDVLGVRPVLGRFFLPGEDAVGGPPVTVISYENWQARYGGDPAVLGRPVHFDEGTYTIIGVLPKGLSLDHGEATSPFWIPVGQDSENAQERGNRDYDALARLKPGVSVAAASQELDGLLRDGRTRDAYGVRLQDWQGDQTRTVRTPLLFLLGAAGLLMLIACVNVTTLMLGEAATRQQEMAARIAMGAGHRRIVGQLLTEGFVLAAGASALGTVLAWSGTRLLVAMAPPHIPGLLDVRMDLRVLAFAILVTLLVGMIVGMAPALTLARSNPAGILRAGSGQSERGRGGLQRSLIAVELSLSVVLLVAAGLLSRTLEKLTAVDPGFRPDNLLVLKVLVPGAVPGAESISRFYAEVADRIGALPGVAGVTAITTYPFGRGSSSTSFEVEGEPEVAPPGQPRHEAQQRTTLPGFFEVMGIPVLKGRVYTRDDGAGAPRVLVINETLARRDWPSESPIGKRIKFKGEWREIIGIVGDSRFSRLSVDAEAMVFAPLAQRSNAGLAILVRGRRDPSPLVAGLGAAVKEVDPNAVLLGSDLMTDLIRQSFGEERYRAVLIVLFGVIAAVLAAAGMYGVTSRAVARRTREMGVRMALGANPASVTGMMVRQSLAGVAIGVGIGLVGSLLLARYLAQFLFGITATDPLTYLVMLAFLGGVSLVASWLPARRAGRVEPAVVLRGE